MRQRLPVVVIVALVAALACGIASADLLDLTYTGYTGAINGAWFLALDQATSTGTGTFDVFQSVGSNSAVEQGYNMDVNSTSDPANPDMKSQSHLIQWSAIPRLKDPRTNPSDQNSSVLVNGWFAEFRADINQNGSGTQPYVSLDGFEVWASDRADLGTASSLYYSNWNTLGSGTSRIYTMAGGPYDGIAMNYNLNAGSGNGDLFCYIPYYEFASYIAASGVTDPYIYVVTHWGGYALAQSVHDELGAVFYNDPAAGGNWGNNDGFEEWGVSTTGNTQDPPPNEVPEPGTMALLLLGLSAGTIAKKRRAAA